MNVGVALLVVLLLLALVAACAVVARQFQGDRTRLEERAADLSASATRLRAVADAVTEAILILAGNGQVTLANRAAHRLFGAADGTLTGCHVEQLLPAFRPGASDLPVAGSGPGQAEVAAFRRDGTSFSAQVDSRLVADGEGRIVVVRDMSEVRAQSAALLHQTLHDSLTGFPTTGSSGRRSSAAWRSPRRGEPRSASSSSTWTALRRSTRASATAWGTASW
jgi:PAS domain S-box-containing protein